MVDKKSIRKKKKKRLIFQSFLDTNVYQWTTGSAIQKSLESWCEACDSLRKRNRCFTNDDGFGFKTGWQKLLRLILRLLQWCFIATDSVLVDVDCQYEYLYRRYLEA
jgi:hypothetical protein